MTAVALVPVVVTALWVHLVLLDGDAFVDLTGDILDEDAVRFAVRETLADEIEVAVPEVREFGLRPFVVVALDATMETGAFRHLFANSVASAHRQLADGEDEIAVRLDDVYPLVAQRLRPVAPAIADNLAARESGVAVTLVERTEQPLLWSAFQWIRAGSVAVVVGFVVLMGLAVAVAPARAQALGLLGLGGAAVAVVTMALAPQASAPFTRHDPVIGPGVDAAWGVVATTVMPIALVLAIALAIIGLAGLTLSLRR